MFWLPLFFWFHGVPTTDPVFLGTSAYVIGVAVFCAYLISMVSFNLTHRRVFRLRVPEMVLSLVPQPG